MTRLTADFLLMLTALIWGVAFIAQKTALDHIGPYTFTATRFLLSALVVLPFFLREQQTAEKRAALRGHLPLLCLTCTAFFAGVILQQIGIGKTTVTNAGFLTGLYVVFVPVICLFLFREKISRWIVPAAALSVGGVTLLSRPDSLSFRGGDFLILLCAVAFAFHVALVGRLMRRAALPFTLCFMQYLAAALGGCVGALWLETPDTAAVIAAGGAILYAGLVSGGIAYTLQAVAQQYTPSSNSAIILGAEALFAALAGALWLGDRLDTAGYAGCALIAAAIVAVELGPRLFRKNQ